MSFSPSFDGLVEALTCLPGVGQKTAQRIALQLLLKKQDKALALAQALAHALQTVTRCRQCRSLSDSDICQMCANPKRSQHSLCVVALPDDVLAIEQSTDYRGLYFVLMGHIAPLDGVGPEALGLDVLEQRLAEGHINELVLAINSTVEGEMTAYFIADIAAKYGVPTTRLASGMPMGGVLSHIDKGTLALAFNARQRYGNDPS